MASMATARITDWIEVGEVSAERDPNLQHYFYDAGVSASIVSNPKEYLLLGRKGAGKTAVYLHLISRPSAVFKKADRIVGLSLQSYNWRAHHLLSNEQRSGGFQHRDSWRFVLCVEALRASIKYFDEEGTDAPAAIRKASRVLEQLFSKPLPSWLDLLGTKLFSLATAKLPNLSAGEDGISVGAGEISFEQVKQSSALQAQLNSNLEALTSYLETCLESLPNGLRLFLVFDRLDEAWVEDFLSQSKAIISGLLHASEYVLHRYSGRIRPLVFLREDIFSTLDINDRNKLREDCSESLRWSQDAIDRLVLERINFYAKRAGKLSLVNLQEIFF
ncbi:MAG TPA: hypothetical protein VHW71_08920 [Steroidobacteraceae bacterium]|jgi:hypothetical protein|nr:hypothetical protein [Steroidobacteraceae bacterium]